MRIIRFINEQGKTVTGIQIQPDLAEVLPDGPFGALRPTGLRSRVGKLLAPIVPPNVFCIGLNYREHARESNSPLPETPVLFAKPTTAVTDPGAPIVIPACCDPRGEVDYECELAVVMGLGPGGRAAHDVSEADALKYVLGYTAANDVSARRWQRNNGGQWIRGKSFDTFCPLGPAIVTPGPGPDEIADPQKLALKTILNGQVMQSHTTGDMIFTVAQVVSFLSQGTTLLPGTVILTGTPQGVGFARKPPVWLEAGDSVTIEIEGIGQLTNPVKA